MALSREARVGLGLTVGAAALNYLIQTAEGLGLSLSRDALRVLFAVSLLMFVLGVVIVVHALFVPESAEALAGRAERMGRRADKWVNRISIPANDILPPLLLAEFERRFYPGLQKLLDDAFRRGFGLNSTDLEIIRNAGTGGLNTQAIRHLPRHLNDLAHDLRAKSKVSMG